MRSDVETLKHVLEARARSDGDSPALLDSSGRVTTYTTLLDLSRIVSTSLLELGVGRDDVVASLLPSTELAAVAFFGVSSIGALAPLHPAWTANEVAEALDRLEPNLVIVDGQADAARRGAARRGIEAVELSQLLMRRGGVTGAEDHDLPRSGDAVVLVLQTSGTTGEPKLVPLTHENVIAASEASRLAYGLSSTDVAVNVMPLFHILGLVGSVVTTVVTGGSVVLLPRFDPELLLQAVASFHGTWLTATPAMHARILEYCREFPEAAKIDSLRFVRSGTAPLPGGVRSAIEETLGVAVTETYGMSEAHQIASTPLDPTQAKPGTLGLPTASEVAVLVDDRITPEGTGEILIRGRNVTAGYLNPSGASGDSFVDGWFRTGDLGHVDSDGYLSLQGRLRDVINRGGQKISAWEVDQLLNEHPLVVDAAVFAVEHPLYGEDVAVAVVASRDAIPPDAVRAFLVERLAPYKVPRTIHYVETIPRTPTGKVKRHLLPGLTEVSSVSATDPLPAETRDDSIERSVIELWEELIGTTPILAEDDFFALGGDSLAEAAFRSRIWKQFKVEVPPDAFYQEDATARAVARLVANAVHSENS